MGRHGRERARSAGPTCARSSGTTRSRRSRREFGVTEDEAADAVAQVLPTIVDKVSPEGHLAPESELESAFGALEHLGDPATG